jgi:hypothetical protein
MTLYSCKCGNTQEIGKQTIRYRDNGWRTIEARCQCGLWMDSEPEEGMPTIRRTEPSLTKRRDKLWAGAKEKRVGERGINESFD